MVGWHYHLDAEPSLTGLHFLALSAGFVLASHLVRRFYPDLPLRTIGIAASALAFVSLLALSILTPPFPSAWRIGLLAVTGSSAGALTFALFYVNQSLFESAPATSANRAGALFVGGALLSTVTAGVTYFGCAGGGQTAFLSLFPLSYLFLLARNRFPAALSAATKPDARQRETFKDLRRIAKLLFSLLIFFQVACEWAIAAWLPLFLIHTSGMNPVISVLALGAYFAALMVGRLIAQLLMPLVSHRRMLLFGVALAIAGCCLLSLAAFTSGWLTSFALVAAIVIGLGHAPIYPLVAERIGKRLSYHAGDYSRSISVAVAAAMATPWLLGYVAGSFGMRAVMLAPAIASIIVLILVILIMFEARLMGSRQIDSENGLLASEQ